MNFKKTLVLAVVLAASVLYLAKVALPAKEQFEKRDIVLPSFDSGRVASIVVARAPKTGSAETFSLVNGGSAVGSGDSDSSGDIEADRLRDWSIKEFSNAPLDSGTLNTLLTTLQNLKLSGSVASEQADRNFSVYGLDQPVLNLIVEGRDGIRTDLSFGSKSEYLNQRFVKVSGRPEIALVDDYLFTSLDKSSSDLRSKTPVKINDSDVRELKIRSSIGDVVLRQVADGEWTITAPIEKPASTKAVSELLRAVKDLRVSEFQDPSKPPMTSFGLDKPAVLVSLTNREGVSPKNYEVRVSKVTSGSDKDKVDSIFFTHTGAPTAFKSVSDPFPAIAVGAEALREKRLVKFDDLEVEKLTVTGPGVSPVEILRKDIGFTVNGKDGDSFFIEQVLTNVVELEAVEFAKDVPADAFAAPNLSVSITKKGAAEPVVLSVGKKVGDKYFARLGSDGEAVLITEEAYKRIVLREETLVAPTPTAAAEATKEG